MAFQDCVGFVSAAPIIDPNGNYNDYDNFGYNNATGGFISPNLKDLYVTELGFWTTAADTNVNFQIGLYLNDGTNPSLLGSPITSGAGVISANNGSWFRVSVKPVLIQPSTFYGINVAISSSATNVGLGGNTSFFPNSWIRYISNVEDGQLLSPWPGGGFGDDRTLAFYALYTQGLSYPFLNWKRKCKIVVNKNYISEDLYDFPILLNQNILPSEMLTLGGQYACNSDGSDIRVTIDECGSNECPIEVAYISLSSDPSQSKAEIYTKLPVIYSSADTEFYIWYGNSSATGYDSSSTYGRNNVWSNGYVGVWHLNNSVVDSTSSNSLTVSINSTFIFSSASPFKIGYYQFDGYGNYIRISAAPPQYSMSDLSLEAWGYKPSTSEDNDSWLLDFDYTGYRLWSNYNINNIFAIRDPDTFWTFLNGTPTLSAWHYVVGTYNQSTIIVKSYIDNIFNLSAFSNFYEFSLDGSTYITLGSHNNLYNNWNGYIDEVRISNVERSSSWISATHFNVNYIDSFLSASISEDTYPIVINYFSASPEEICKDSSSNLYWEIKTLFPDYSFLNILPINYSASISSETLSGINVVYPTYSTSYILSAWATKSIYDYFSVRLSAWNYVCPLSIDSSKYVGDIDNFRIFLTWNGVQSSSNLPEILMNGQYAKSDGSDIRFTTDISGINELPFDIAIFSANSDTSKAYAEIWVKYNLSGDNNSNIYLWFGNPSASAYSSSNTYGRNNVWSPAYGVWHIKEVSGSSALDSAGNNTGYYVSALPNLQTQDWFSQYGNGESFIYTTNAINNPTVYVYNTWFKCQSGDGGVLISFGNSRSATPTTYDRHFYVDTNGKLRYGIYPGTIRYLVTSSSVDDDLWHMGTIVQSGSYYALYLDGVFQSSANNGPPQNIANGYFRIFQNLMTWWDYAPSGFYYFKGSMWNPFILSGTISSNFVSAMYNSQSNPSSFITVDNVNSNYHPEYYWLYQTSAYTNVTVKICGIDYRIRGIMNGTNQGIFVGI